MKVPKQGSIHAAKEGMAYNNLNMNSYFTGEAVQYPPGKCYDGKLT